MADHFDKDLPPDPPLFDDQVEGDFRAEDYRLPDECGPEVDPSFVDDTLRRIMADRETIVREAAQVDDLVLPKDLLAAYSAPEPSSDFLRSCQARIAQASADDAANLREVLKHLEAPRAHPDFVERTLDALRVQRSGLRLVDSPADEAAATQPRWSRRAFAWLLAAAVLVAAINQFWPRTDLAGDDLPRTAQSAQSYTLVAWGTNLSRMHERGLRFETVDSLEFLANEAAIGGR